MCLGFLLHWSISTPTSTRVIAETSSFSHWKRDAEKNNTVHFNIVLLTYIPTNTKQIFQYHRMLINYTQTCSKIIKLYVSQWELTLLIMNDFLCKIRSWIIYWLNFEKSPFFINTSFLNLCSKKQISFGCDSKHIKIKGPGLGRKFLADKQSNSADLNDKWYKCFSHISVSL